MKIFSVDCKKFNRVLEKPLETAHGTINEREGHYILIKSENGIAGMGEISPLPGYSTAPEDNIYTVLNETFERLHDLEVPRSAEEIAGTLDAYINDVHIRFGFETALCDLAARIEQKPLCEWLSGRPAKAVPVNYLMNRTEDIEEQIAHAERRGFKAVKVKVGFDRVDREASFIRELRGKLREDILLRVDANRAFNFVDALLFLDGIREGKIDYIEEPLQEFSAEAYQRLKAKTSLRIALDESITRPENLEAAFELKLCHVMVLKAAHYGGLFPVIDIVERGRGAGMEVVMTSMLETEVALAAQLHLAAALGFEIPCGFDTLRLYEKRQTWFPGASGGILSPPEGIGLGIPGTFWGQV